MGRHVPLVWRYYLFQATDAAGFYVPVAILFLGAKGFGPGFVGLSYAVFSFAGVAAEIPTGYVGDRLGRRGSLAVGNLVRIGSLVGYALADSAAAFLFIHVCWATGRAFRSGTQDAWLYELLDDRGDADEFTRVKSRANTVLLATSALSAVAGAALYGTHVTLPFLANAALLACSLPVLYSFPTASAEGPDDDDDEPFTVRAAVGLLGDLVRRPEIRWFVTYAALFHALFLVTRVYEQPALRAVGVPVTGLGVLYAAFKLVSAGAAATSDWLAGRLGTRRVFALLVPAYGLAYAAIALVPVAVVPVLFCNRALRVLTQPIRNQYLNDRLGDTGRATALSGAAMALATVGGVARLVAGWGTEQVGVVPFLPLAGVVVAGVAAVAWLATSPVRSGTPAREPPADGPLPSD